MSVIHENLFLNDFNESNRQGNDGECLVLLILNSDGSCEDLVRHLWNKVDLRVCADGGANRLYDMCHSAHSQPHPSLPFTPRSFSALPSSSSLLLPDFVKGDLDSIRRKDVWPFYTAAGVPVLHDSNQDNTDLEKCLDEILRLRLTQGQRVTACGEEQKETKKIQNNQGNEGNSDDNDDTTMSTAAGMDSDLGIDSVRLHRLRHQPVTVLVVGGFDGSFHHDLGNVHVLFKYAESFERMLLVGSTCMAELLVGPELCTRRKWPDFSNSSSSSNHNEFPTDKNALETVVVNIKDETLATQAKIGPSDSSNSNNGNENDRNLLPLTIRHELWFSRGIEGPTCGLYPVQQPCDCVRSNGLKWDLDGNRLEFGLFISTSNQIVNYQAQQQQSTECDGDGSDGDSGIKSIPVPVVIETSHTLLWTHTYRLPILSTPVTPTYLSAHTVTGSAL